jgi:hypothetical protein
MTSSPQQDQPPADQHEPQQPPQESLPTAPDPALVNITEKGREPHQTRVERDP